MGRIPTCMYIVPHRLQVGSNQQRTRVKPQSHHTTNTAHCHSYKQNPFSTSKCEAPCHKSLSRNSMEYQPRISFVFHNTNINTNTNISTRIYFWLKVQNTTAFLFKGKENMERNDVKAYRMFLKKAMRKYHHYYHYQFRDKSFRTKCTSESNLRSLKS